MTSALIDSKVQSRASSCLPSWDGNREWGGGGGAGGVPQEHLSPAGSLMDCVRIPAASGHLSCFPTVWYKGTQFSAGHQEVRAGQQT